jgi:hypothetical protein
MYVHICRTQAAALGVLVADVLGLSVGEMIERVRRPI